MVRSGSKRPLLGLLITFCMLFAPVWAQAGGKVSVSISSDTISMDEAATLTLSVEGLTDDIDVDLPQSRGGGLQIMPSGRNYSMTSINGQTQSSVQLSYRITALRTGRHLIEPITGTVGGVPFTTGSTRLEVTDYGTGQSAGNSGSTAGSWPPQPRIDPWASGGFWPGQPVLPEPREDDVILEAVVEPQTVYKHQPIFYNLRLLTAVRLLSDPRYNPIAPTGFLRVAFDQENGEEDRNGRFYTVSAVKTAYFPLTEGEFTFDPTQVQVSPGAFSMARTLTTEPQTVTVLPLPTEGRPESFTGAVGQEFEIRASLVTPEIASDGTAELEVTVKGDGHLDLVPYPYLPNWANLEKKQGKSPSTTTVENGRIVSRRTYNFRLKPTRAGSFDLSGIALAYFNPAEKRYEVIKAPSLTLTVENNKSAGGAGPGQTESQLDEADRPLAFAGPTRGRLPELPAGPMAVGVGLLMAAAWLARPGGGARRTGPLLPARAGKTARRHKSFSELLASLEKLAPGADTGSRQAYLQGKGWSDPQIARLEALRRKAGRAEYGGGGSDGATLETLDKELAALLKETPK